MMDPSALETALYAAQADVRVLDLLGDAEDNNSGWDRYGIPREDGFDLKRVRCSDSTAALMALRRLASAVDEAIAAFHAA